MKSTGLSRDRCRLASLSEAHAGAWWGALPSQKEKTHLSGPDFRALAKWWLGMPQMPDHLAGAECPRCSVTLDIWGDHAVCCKLNSLTQRHMALQDSLMDIVRSVGLSCRREAALTGQRKRPGDLLIPRWDSDGPAAVDLTIRHHQLPSGPLRDPALLTQWLDKQEDQKNHLYQDQCARQSWQFMPFVIDTWGSMSGTARKVMQGLLRLALTDPEGKEKRSINLAEATNPPMKIVARQLRIHDPVLLDAPRQQGGTQVHSPYDGWSASLSQHH